MLSLRNVTRLVWGASAGALILLSLPSATARVIYVNAKVPPGGTADGLTWASAVPTLQEGLALAASGDEVWVAAGTYLATGTNRFLLPSGVRLYGGFAGSETELSQRDAVRQVTILDGNGVFGSVVTIATDATADTRLDGFRIQNGRANEGGGVYCRGGAPVIANNVITRNEAISAGAGVYCFNSSARVVGNRIFGQTYRALDNPIGGGIGCDGGAPVIEENQIYGNAALGAAGLGCRGSAAVIRHNLILGNRAAVAGGGIECDNAAATIENNRIIGNVVHRDGLGGAGIFCGGDVGPRVINNLIYANVLSPAVRSGSGAGILVQPNTPATIHNNTIARNLSLAGRPALSGSAKSSIVNNLVAFNSAGVEFRLATDLRRNCAFGNPGKDFVGPENLVFAGGNISLDPRIVENDLLAQVHLLPDSPCREAGDTTVVGAGAVDLDGQSRVQGAAVDIGSDESDGNTTEFPARVVHVRPDGDDDHDGSSWALALRTVQAAIATAASTGAEVWVAAGTYPERIELAPLVHLFGGFRGDEASRTARDWRTNASVLDGQQAGSVVRLVYVDRFASLDGFTVRNGRATEGGGIVCRVFSGVIRNNLIEDNRAARGGGLAILDSSSPTVEGNRFIGNVAVHDPAQFPGEVGGMGGGLLLDTAPAEIINNSFLSNSATATAFVVRPGPGGGPAGSGGAIFVGLPSREPQWGQSRYDMLEAMIANNTLLHNIARATDGQRTEEQGGGMWFNDGIQVVNNLICFNSSGAMFGRLSSPSANGHPVRFNCVFGNGNDWVLRPGQSAPTGQNGNISVDPLLVAASDFHLQAESPCRDAGDGSVVRTRWRDLDNERRVQDAAVDIGADEVTAASIGRNYFADWQAAHFPGQTDPTVIGPHADPDADGMQNVVEFAFDRTPTVADAGPGPLRASLLPGAARQVVLEYTRLGVVGIGYAIESSGDLRTWTPLPSPVTPKLARVGDGQIKVTYGSARELPASAPRVFYRLKITLNE